MWQTLLQAAFNKKTISNHVWQKSFKTCVSLSANVHPGESLKICYKAATESWKNWHTTFLKKNDYNWVEIN